MCECPPQMRAWLHVEWHSVVEWSRGGPCLGKLSSLHVAFIMSVTVMNQPGDKMTLICISAGVFLLSPRLTLLLLLRLHVHFNIGWGDYWAATETTDFWGVTLTWASLQTLRSSNLCTWHITHGSSGLIGQEYKGKRWGQKRDNKLQHSTSCHIRFTDTGRIRCCLSCCFYHNIDLPPHPLLFICINLIPLSEKRGHCSQSPCD